ncbi:hypothetical protein [Paraburkholderia sp.]|uniref:hypothetical protein n=1 Tax=Paraburkholderia sp. TaxID=1926495 RepID=UPI0023972B5B|nr:hypothetical protein [Paraburkholderia sp.]MDE1179389.1 hypothetical protein [Paraburkholderia sp.]
MRLFAGNLLDLATGNARGATRRREQRARQMHGVEFTDQRGFPRSGTAAQDKGVVRVVPYKRYDRGEFCMARILLLKTRVGMLVPA